MQEHLDFSAILVNIAISKCSWLTVLIKIYNFVILKSIKSNHSYREPASMGPWGLNPRITSSQVERRNTQHDKDLNTQIHQARAPITEGPKGRSEDDEGTWRKIRQSNIKVRATTPGLVLALPLTRSNCVILNKLPSVPVLSAPTKYYNNFLPTEPLQS